jgi:hypothetical protein
VRVENQALYPERKREEKSFLGACTCLIRDEEGFLFALIKDANQPLSGETPDIPVLPEETRKEQIKDKAFIIGRSTTKENESLLTGDLAIRLILCLTTTRLIHHLAQLLGGPHMSFIC